jgi:hypothetical protein
VEESAAAHQCDQVRGVDRVHRRGLGARRVCRPWQFPPPGTGPGPLVHLVRERTVAKVDSIGLAASTLALRNQQRCSRVVGNTWRVAAQNPSAPSPTASTGVPMPRRQ